MAIGSSKARMLAGVVMAASLAAPLALSARADGDEWVVIAEFTAPAPSLDVMRTTLAQAYAAVAVATGGKKSCVPTTSNYPDRLAGQTLLNITTGQIVYRWNGPGAAYATKDCASGVTVRVTVTDVSGTGAPTRQRGGTYTATNNRNSSTAWGAMTTTAQPEVVYYDPSRAYQRATRWCSSASQLPTRTG